jgi:hypothetical protein
MKRTKHKMTKYHITIKRAQQYFLIYYREIFGEWPYYNDTPYPILLRAHKNYNRAVNNPNSLYNKVNHPNKQQK